MQDSTGLTVLLKRKSDGEEMQCSGCGSGQFATVLPDTQEHIDAALLFDSDTCSFRCVRCGTLYASDNYVLLVDTMPSQEIESFSEKNWPKPLTMRIQ